MLDTVSSAVSLGENIYDRENPAENAASLAQGIIDNTPLKIVIDIPVEKIEGGLSKIEKVKMVQATKAKFHQHISQAAANAVSSFTTPSVRLEERKAQLKSKKGQSYLDSAQKIYEKHQGSRGYKTQRKLQDIARVFKKSPVKLVKIPLSLVPLGELAKVGISGAEYVGGKFAGKRRERKHDTYLSLITVEKGKPKVKDNQAAMALEAQLGKQLYDRKVAKWSAKDLAELGPKIQRNLYKLKQSVEILNGRKAYMEACSQKYVKTQLRADAGAFKKSLDDASMSLFEVEHYIKKIKNMSDTLHATSESINAHLIGLEQVMQDSRERIKDASKHN